MRIVWDVTKDDADRLRSFVNRHSSDPFVQDRIDRNLATSKRRVQRPEFWRELVGCLLTTQQKSGPDCPVARFLRARPFALAYLRVKEARDPEAFARGALKRWGGIRRGPTIAQQLTQNLRFLEDGKWKPVLDSVNSLANGTGPDQESAVAEGLARALLGLGPKQSRNLLQGLGLTRFEVPIDSRLTRWLNEFGFPFKLSAGALSDPNFYRFVSDGFQQLCLAAGVFPCVVDAAIFASFDKGGWTRAKIGSGRRLGR